MTITRQPLIGVATMLLAAATVASCSSPKEPADVQTFTNPVLWADVPDPDVIRVGDYFYMVSTTMHLMPGGPIMRSRDLVNWETISYLFDRLDETPKYDMEEGTVYGRGQWATSLRYRDGWFYALFSPNDEPHRSFVYKTQDPAKGWTLHSRMKHFHDASLFLDDDGRAYVFYATGRLTELEPDLSAVRPDGVDMTIFQRDSTENGLLEGSRVIKHEGRYYLLMISWPKGGIRREVCYRADSITGPYEKKVILETRFADFGGVAQGVIVDDKDGNWYGVIFQDRGGVGRVLTLMPCRWVDGWPMLGDDAGNVPLTMPRPVQGEPDIPLVVSDDFSNPDALDIHWQWNHNPVASAWSLSERPGFLRLHTSKVVPNLYLAPNTLTQRMEGPQCSATVAIDLAGMKDGDRAGFAAFNGHSGLLTVECDGDAKTLTMTSTVVHLTDREKAVTGVDVEEHARIPLATDTILLRIDGDFRPGRDIATFYYSTDGTTWTQVGGDYKMRFDFSRFFMGTKFAIFNYATRSQGGHVDIDSFTYQR